MYSISYAVILATLIYLRISRLCQGFSNTDGNLNFFLILKNLLHSKVGLTLGLFCMVSDLLGQVNLFYG